MTSNEFRNVLLRRLEKPYEKQNDYYAWKKRDGTWFMLGMECYRDKHILKYEFDPHFKDYGAAFYSIDPHVTHRRGPQVFDPLQELISQVEEYEYLGSWREPEIFMDDGRGGKVAACGRWEAAREHIMNEYEKVHSSQGKGPRKAVACNGVPIFDGYGGVMSVEDAERLEESWERAENYAMGKEPLDAQIAGAEAVSQEKSQGQEAGLLLEPVDR